MVFYLFFFAVCFCPGQPGQVLFLQGQFSGEPAADPVPAVFHRCLLNHNFHPADGPYLRTCGQGVEESIQVVPVEPEEQLLLSGLCWQKCVKLLPVCRIPWDGEDVSDAS